MVLISNDDVTKIRSVWVATVLLFSYNINFYHLLTELHLSKLIIAALSFRELSKLSGVNTAITDFRMERF